MKIFGCQDKFITVVRQFHDGMMAKVLEDDDASDTFPVTSGVKQGRVLTPTLFCVIFAILPST